MIDSLLSWIAAVSLIRVEFSFFVWKGNWLNLDRWPEVITDDRQQRISPCDFRSDCNCLQFSCTLTEDTLCVKTCCKPLISLTFLKKSFKFLYSLRRQMVFFDWIDRDFMSKHISWFHFVGLVDCSLYVLCCSQSFLVICFWMVLSKSYKELNMQKSPWKTLVMPC